MLRGGCFSLFFLMLEHILRGEKMKNRTLGRPFFRKKGRPSLGVLGRCALGDYFIDLGIAAAHARTSDLQLQIVAAQGAFVLRDDVAVLGGAFHFERDAAQCGNRQLRYGMHERPPSGCGGASISSSTARMIARSNSMTAP